MAGGLPGPRAVSLPRRVEPGRTHLISRRCSERRFFLRPSKVVVAVIRFALALACERYGILLHAVMVESTHYHLVLTDPRGVLPDFQRDLDALVGRALNSHYGRGEAFWCPGSYSNVELHDADAVLDKLVYLWANPVQDGLVARPEQWPGFASAPEDMGVRVEEAVRPDTAFFGGRRPDDWEPTFRNPLARLARAARTGADDEATSTLPERATLRFTVPPALDHLPLEEVHALARDRLEARVAEVHEERERQGLTSFLGADAVRRQDPFASAGSTAPTFDTNPRMAGRDTADRVARLAELVGWRRAYAEALAHWRAGDRTVVFPHGTYALPTYHGARVERAPP